MLILLYLADISSGLTLLLVLLGILGLICVFVILMEGRFLWKYFLISILSLVISALVPSKDFLYKALVVEVTKEVATSDSFNSGIAEISNTTKKLLDVINSKLDEQLPKKDK